MTRAQSCLEAERRLWRTSMTHTQRWMRLTWGSLILRLATSWSWAGCSGGPPPAPGDRNTGVTNWPELGSLHPGVGPLPLYSVQSGRVWTHGVYKQPGQSPVWETSDDLPDLWLELKNLGDDIFRPNFVLILKYVCFYLKSSHTTEEGKFLLWIITDYRGSCRFV